MATPATSALGLRSPQHFKSAHCAVALRRAEGHAELRLQLLRYSRVLSVRGVSGRSSQAKVEKDKYRVGTDGAAQSRGFGSVQSSASMQPVHPRSATVQLMASSQDRVGVPLRDGLAIGPMGQCCSFVEFESHEHALAALRELNNNSACVQWHGSIAALHKWQLPTQPPFRTSHPTVGATAD